MFFGYIISINSGKLNRDEFLNRARKLIVESSLRKTMGQRGREKVLSAFTNEQSTQKYLELLNTISK